ncbi:MAG: hypothetical protein A2992_05315 [Elusimicrobia bacterium RIFCSPLOWO2_01_FULL_59_12]|nr:MAG: hypothetical protein A2992_05315 [Elusimicrobia bacterium RIFCSPLOWO2_01_FULL_59_12]
MLETVTHVLGELSNYLNGRLPRAERKRVAGHLETCADCRRHAEELSTLRKMVYPHPVSFLERFPLKILIAVCAAAGVALTLGKLRRPASHLFSKQSAAPPVTKPASLPAPKETSQPAAPAPPRPVVDPPKAAPGQLPEWQGPYSGISDPRNVVLQTREEWDTHWQEHHALKQPPPPLPDLDFSQVTIVGVHAGSLPTGSYAIEIYEIQLLPDNVVVHFRETPPLPNADPSVQLIQPYHLRVIPKTTLPVRFNRQPILP